MEKLSKDDLFRVSLLKGLSECYLEGKEKYEAMPQKVNSLLQMISTLDPQYEAEMQKYWGQIKLIQAEAIYDKKEILKGQDNKDFDAVVRKIKELCSRIEVLQPFKPEDPYTWPFEEYN